MSRGLGQLQRMILSTLDDAQKLETGHLGYDSFYDEVRYHGRSMKLPGDVYDMRASAFLLAQASGKVRNNLCLRRSTIATAAFSAAFCRAVRTLEREGYLTAWSSPIYRDTPTGVKRWANRRFMKRTEKPFSPVSTDTYNAYRRDYLSMVERRRQRDERIFAAVSARLH